MKFDIDITVSIEADSPEMAFERANLAANLLLEQNKVAEIVEVGEPLSSEELENL